MASNFFKIDRGLTLAPQTSIASPQNGDVYYDSTRNTYVFRNNGASVDLQSRSDVATASSLTSTDFTASVTQSSLVKLTGSTASNVHGLTASSDGKMVVIYNGSSAIITIKNASATEGTAANRILTSTGLDVSLNASEAVQLTYDSAQSRWIVVSSPGSGSGGTGKNYLSRITASFGAGVPNTGNGDFESGSTTGWSLGTTGTLTSGIPTGTPSFGSGASGNLSLAVASTNTLAGKFSLDYISSAATTAGNMVASDAFFIDAQDQAKVLQFKFAYKAQTNPTNGNFSGTSSNSFGVAVWDVTNSVWLNNTGNFNIVQNSGIGFSTGIFQTGATTQSIRFVFYNANASAGAITMRLDDFVVGPQVIPAGAAMTEWVAWTPTGSWVANSTYTGYKRRVGDTAEYQIKVTLGGAPTNTSLSINYPSGEVEDTNKNLLGDGNFAILGRAELRQSGVGDTLGYVRRNSTTSVVILAEAANTAYSQGAILSTTVPFTWGSADTVTARWAVPIAGWGSQTAMSNDTDTRVIDMVANKIATQAVTANTTNITFPSVVKDNTASWSGSVFTVPVAGDYVFGISGVLDNAGAAQTFSLYKNGSQFRTGGTIPATASYSINLNMLATDCVPGDQFSIRTSATTTIGAQGGIQIWRLSGPATIAATESVNGSYTDTAGSSIPTSAAVYTFATKVRDSHNIYSSGTLTIPISGMYRFSASLVTASLAFTSTQNMFIEIRRNGTRIAFGQVVANGSVTTTWQAQANVAYPCNPGDTIDVRAQSSVATTGNTGAGVNNFCWERIGN